MVRVLGTAGTMLGWWGWGSSPPPSSAMACTTTLSGEGWLCYRHRQPAVIYSILGRHGHLSLGGGAVGVGELVRAADEHVPGGKWPDGLAGAVCGLCILLRYASLFLVVYAAGLML